MRRRLSLCLCVQARDPPGASSRGPREPEEELGLERGPAPARAVRQGWVGQGLGPTFGRAQLPLGSGRDSFSSPGS